MKIFKYIAPLFLILLTVSCSGGGGSSSTNSGGSGGGDNPTNTLNFTESQYNISSTIYSGASHKLESVVFTFINQESTSVHLGTVTIAESSVILWTLESNACSNAILSAEGGKCNISGSVEIAESQTGGRMVFFLPSSDGRESYNYSIDIYGIQYIDNYAGLHIATPDGDNNKIFFVGLVGGVESYPYAVPITYTLTNGVYIGQIGTESVSSIAPYTIEIPSSGMTIYTPVMLNHGANAGGRFYASYESPLTAATGAMPDPLSQNVSSFYFEYNVPSLTAVYTDMTYVDFTSVPVSINSVNENTNYNISMGIKPAFYNVSGATILANMESALNQFPGVYNLAAYTLRNENSDLIAILSPSSVFTQPDVIPAGFESAIFNTYTADLWTYYATSGNYLQINGDEIANQLSGSGCILRGHVEESDSLMHFNPYPNGSNCPTGTYIAGGQTFDSGPNSFTLQESDFNYYGFYSAFGNQSVYGENGTYQSLLKYVAGAQAAGFLPFCPESGGSSTFIYGHEVLAPYSSQYFKPNYRCLPNYSQYGESVINQYDHQVHLYFNSYGYGYDDTIGIDSTVTSDSTQFPNTVHILKDAN